MKKKRKKKLSPLRYRSLKLGLILLAFFTLWGVAAEWFVHHPRAWIASQPTLLAKPMLWFGNPLADFTDALGWTGYDTVCEYDTAAPSGEILFAGAPRRVSAPAPSDIRILNRGEFLIGWSDSLRHPVWCAYRVTREAPYENFNRPGFTKDRTLPAAPAPNDYTHSGYDRGHMVPNYAIVTRYGKDVQRKTFQMSNIAPQTPALNRSIWRDIEHRIADLWATRYGEVWVIVGAVSASQNRETIGATGIDVPCSYYQVIMAQEGMDVRALAILVDQTVDWRAWPQRHIVTIDELEEKTGLDFNPDLPSFIQEPLESDLPTRLWPIRLRDIFRLISIRFY